MSVSICMDDKEVFSFSFETEHIKNVRLALVQTFKLCLDELYTLYAKASYGDDKYLRAISALINRIDPAVQKKKEAEKKKKKEEEEGWKKCWEIKEHSKEILGE